MVIVNHASLRALRGSDLQKYNVVNGIKSNLEFKVHKGVCVTSIPIPISTQVNYKHENLSLNLTERGLGNSLSTYS